MINSKEKRPVGRPKNKEQSHVLRLRIPKALNNKIQETAKEKGMKSVSDYVRLTMLLDFLKKEDLIYLEYKVKDGDYLRKVNGYVKKFDSTSITLMPIKAGKGNNYKINDKNTRERIPLDAIRSVLDYKESTQV